MITQEWEMTLAKIQRDFQEYGLPPYMWDGTRLWLERGIPPGHFLTAVLKNELASACAHADSSNVNCLPMWVKFFYNCTPGGCWGSPSNFTAWSERGGMEGFS